MSIDTMLKGNELFKSLSVEEVHRISNFSSAKEFNANEMVFVHDRPSTHCYVLMDGVVYLQLPSSLPEFSLNIAKVRKGELFGLSPLLDSPRYTASAKCYAPTKVLAIEAKPVREILQKNHLVGMDVMSRVARIYFTRYIDLVRRLQEVVGQVSLVP
jgi:CRP-like cAMP-binding protein